MKLSSIDDLRKDGKFYDDRGNIPEGAYNLRIISIKERVV